MKLYHLAIPKTATESLQQSMKDANLDVFITMKEEPKLNYLEAARHKIVSGHFHYGLHHLISPRETNKYFTVLRNPLHRAISDYCHHIRVNTEWVVRLTLLEYLNLVPQNIISIQMFGFGITQYHEAKAILKEDYAAIGCIEKMGKFYPELSDFLGVELKENVLNTGSDVTHDFNSKFVEGFVSKHKLDYMIWEKVFNEGVVKS